MQLQVHDHAIAFTCTSKELCTPALLLVFAPRRGVKYNKLLVAGKIGLTALLLNKASLHLKPFRLFAHRGISGAHDNCYSVKMPMVSSMQVMMKQFIRTPIKINLLSAFIIHFYFVTLQTICNMIQVSQVMKTLCRNGLKVFLPLTSPFFPSVRRRRNGHRPLGLLQAEQAVFSEACES